MDIWGKQREAAQILANGLKIYRSETAVGGPCAMMFYPKAINPAWNYRFKSAEQMEEYISGKIANYDAYQKMKDERKAARRGTADDLNAVAVGDIFHFSWGYDQTNCDFFQVVEKSGRSVIIREIGSQTVDKETGNSMADYRIAVKDAFLADKKPLKKLIQFSGEKPYIRMASYGYCDKWDGQPCYCSWYA